MKKVIAIDGPSGAGKSTIAKSVAARFGYQYLDTGALYRAIALGLVNAGLSENSTDEDIENTLEKIKVSYKGGHVYLNNADVEDKIREPEIGHFSSVFSARKPVRDYLMPAQKAAARNDDIVAEGRDMTTVVFPDAFIKIFLDASVEARAGRRYMQFNEKGIEADMEQATRDVTERDARDSSRDIAPLKKADDAMYIDSSNIDADEVVEIICKAVEESARA
jgi:cytidylate kinase